MQITVEIDEALLKSVTSAAVKAAFFSGDRWEGQGAGALAIRKQVNTWVEAQDYTAIIADVAASVMREAVRDAVIEAIRADVKKTVKSMKSTGELATLFDEATW